MSNTCRGDNLSPAKMKNLKNKKGITLIALVLTIIVLLILAGVALSLVVGEDGITGRAVNAGKTQNIAGAKEKLELDVANYASEFYKEKYVSSNQSATSLKDYILGKIVDGADYNVEDKDTTTGEFQISIADGTNATGTVGEDGSVSWSEISTEPVVSWALAEEDGKTIITDGKNKLKLGDYVYYDAVTGASQTEYVSPTDKSGYSKPQKFVLSDYDKTADGWRVLGIENGQILLVAGEFIGPKIYTDSTTGTEYGGESAGDGRTYYYLSGRTGMQYGLNELKNICELYGQGAHATGARSITVDDINGFTGYNPTSYGTTNQLDQYGNEVTYSWDGTSYPSYTATNGYSENGGKLYGIHDPKFYWFDTDLVLHESNKLASVTGLTDEQKRITTLKSTYYYYNAGSMISDSAIKSMLLGNQSGNFYFSNRNSSVKMQYWLGSPYVYCDTSIAYFGLRRVNGGYVYGYYLTGSVSGVSSNYSGVLPVVSLQSGVKLEYNDKQDRWEFANK